MRQHTRNTRALADIMSIICTIFYSPVAHLQSKQNIFRQFQHFSHYQFIGENRNKI